MGRAKNLILGLFLVALLFFFPSSIFASTNIHAPFVQDVYTDQANPDLNWQGQSDNKFRTKTGNSFYTFINFNLSSLPSDVAIDSVILHSYMTCADAHTANVYLVPNNWSESTITWNNQPALGSILGSSLISDSNYYDITLDSTLFKNNRSNFSIGIKTSTDYDSSYCYVNSSWSNRWLSINYSPTSVSIVSSSSNTFASSIYPVLAVVLPLGLGVLITFSLVRKGLRNFKGISKI